MGTDRDADASGVRPCSDRRQLRTLLVGAATLDGDKVTNISHVDECRTTFRTAPGATDLEWAKAGNIAPRLDGGREINDLPTIGGLKPLSMPSGESTSCVSGAIGLLAAECAG